MGLNKPKEDVIYASVLADGRFHVTVPEGTEGSVVRKYKTSDGTEGSKTELVYGELIGKITKINFRDGDYSRQLMLTIEDGKEGSKPVILSLSTSSNYGEDVMKKLISIDMTKTVKLVPYSFVDDNKKNKRGMTIWQKKDGEKAEKIKNYFYDEEKEELLHGYPEPKKGKATKANPDGKLSTEQWKLYFGECREFLVEKITEHFKLEETETVPSMSDEDFDNF